MSEPDFRKMGDPLNDRLPPHPTWRSREQWLKAGAPKLRARLEMSPTAAIMDQLVVDE